MDAKKTGFSYNAYIYVGHYEKPVKSVNAKFATITKTNTGEIDSSDPNIVSGHVGCLAAIMMFRLDVHHPIGLKKFELPRTILFPNGYDSSDSEADDSDAEEFDNSNSDLQNCSKCDSSKNGDVMDKREFSDLEKDDDDSVFNGIVNGQGKKSSKPEGSVHHCYNYYCRLGRHLSQDVSIILMPLICRRFFRQSHYFF